MPIISHSYIDTYFIWWSYSTLSFRGMFFSLSLSLLGDGLVYWFFDYDDIIKVARSATLVMYFNQETIVLFSERLREIDGKNENAKKNIYGKVKIGDKRYNNVTTKQLRQQNIPSTRKVVRDVIFSERVRKNAIHKLYLLAKHQKPFIRWFSVLDERFIYLYIYVVIVRRYDSMYTRESQCGFCVPSGEKKFCLTLIVLSIFIHSFPFFRCLLLSSSLLLLSCSGLSILIRFSCSWSYFIDESTLNSRQHMIAVADGHLEEKSFHGHIMEYRSKHWPSLWRLYTLYMCVCFVFHVFLYHLYSVLLSG